MNPYSVISRRLVARSPYFRAFGLLLVALLFTLSFSPPVYAASATAAAGNSQALQEFIDSGRVPPGIARQIEKSGQADVLVVLNNTDVLSRAANMRRSRGIKNNDAVIMAEKVRLYRQKKDLVLSRISRQSYSVLKDYDNFALLFMTVNANALADLLNMKEVRSVGENKALVPFLAESLPLINQPQAAAAGDTGAGTYVAVLDTGVDYTLSAFGSCTSPAVPAATCKVAYAHDFAPDDGSLDDDPHHHGTNVSAIVVGVAPDTKILGLDVFRTDGFAYYDDIAAALNWVLTEQGDSAGPYYGKIEAVNMSLGGGRYTNPCSGDPLATVIGDLKTAGITVAVASGNDGYKDSIASPACVPAAVSVGAVYDSDFTSSFFNWGVCSDNAPHHDQVACFSNSSSFLTMLAPGAFVTAAGYTLQGTSQATPFVSGAAAVIKGAYSSLSVDDVVSAMTNNGVPITDAGNNITKPRLNLYAALSVLAPYIAANVSSFEFTGPEGGADPAVQTLNISNGGAGSISWTASSDAGWLTVNPTSGTDTGAVTVSVSTAGLTLGIYHANITITASGATNTPRIIPVTLAVVDPSTVEDFETGDLLHLPWQVSGDGLWTVGNATAHGGSWSAEAPTFNVTAGVDPYETAYLQLTKNIANSGVVSFWYRVGNNSLLNSLFFKIDGQTFGNWNGYPTPVDWTRATFPVTAGTHTFSWEFQVRNLTGYAEVDDIVFPHIPGGGVAPASHDFGDVAVGSSSTPQTFTITNSGLGDLVLGTLSFTGLSAGDFSKQNDTCSGQTLQMSANCTVDVTLSPQSGGAKTAELSIPSNDPDVPTLTAALSGTSPVALTVSRTGTGGGTVTSDLPGISCGTACAADYAVNAGVTLSAAPDANSSFAGWSGGGCTGTGSCYVTMDADTTVTATFNILPPTASFSANPDTASGTAPLYVSFTDVSTNSPSSWFWDFGDGGTSTLQNPSHNYKVAGAYTVSLTATNSSGSGSVTRTAYVTVAACGNDPVQLISVTPNGGTYQDLNTAVGLAAGGDEIDAQAIDFTDQLDLNISDGETVTLKGGFGCDYLANPAMTTLNGSITVTGGTLVVENVELQ